MVQLPCFYKKMTPKVHFFSKKFGQFKKKQYFCTRFRKGSKIEGV